MVRGKGCEMQVSTPECLSWWVHHHSMGSIFSPILLQWVQASAHSTDIGVSIVLALLQELWIHQ